MFEEPTQQRSTVLAMRGKVIYIIWNVGLSADVQRAWLHPFAPGAEWLRVRALIEWTETNYIKFVGPTGFSFLNKVCWTHRLFFFKY